MALSIAGAYDGSFASVGFLLLLPITSPPIAQIKTQYHITTTDSNYEIDMGKGMRNWDQKILIDQSGISALEAQVGNSDNYIYDLGTISAKLEGTTGYSKAPGFPIWEITLQLSCGN